MPKLPINVTFTSGDRGAGEDHYVEDCGDRLLVRRELPAGRVQWFIEAEHGGFEAVTQGTLIRVMSLAGDYVVFVEGETKMHPFSWETEV